MPLTEGVFNKRWSNVVQFNYCLVCDLCFACSMQGSKEGGGFDQSANTETTNATPSGWTALQHKRLGGEAFRKREKPKKRQP
mmetsp:Transcript_74715/g.124480  ORF Transcript_74715/g.124480 Transcript_74715/m.124480 type:complete len:82 (-) Transcript_74715:216-461(-)